ncbi:RrF2 family transcriptional regulator [Candidatus Omnitrophota bacterium]
MKISSRVDYALSCVLRIAEAFDSKLPLSVGTISQMEKLEPDYVEQLLIILKKAGLLSSVRGASGGYMLSTSPSKITAKDIVEAIEGKILECVCERKKGRRNKCHHHDDCKLKVFWQGLGDEMESYLRKHTLKGLLFLRKQEKNWQYEGSGI